MSKSPGPIFDFLFKVSDDEARPAELARAVFGLLEAERRLSEVSLGIEGFREASRTLGILDESRNGQRVYEAWSKLSCFFIQPLLAAKEVFTGNGSDVRDAPSSFEALGARWERTIPEIEAFIDEEQSIDRGIAGSPAGGHVSFKLRSRLLLLDRRAERIKVALDLLRRDLAEAAKKGAERLATALERETVFETMGSIVD